MAVVCYYLLLVFALEAGKFWVPLLPLWKRESLGYHFSPFGSALVTMVTVSFSEIEISKTHPYKFNLSIRVEFIHL